MRRLARYASLSVVSPFGHIDGTEGLAQPSDRAATSISRCRATPRCTSRAEGIPLVTASANSRRRVAPATTSSARAVGGSGARRKASAPEGPYRTHSNTVSASGSESDIETSLTCPPAWRQVSDTHRSGSPRPDSSSIGPTVASSRSNRCGPTSSRAPCRRRQGVENGLAASSAPDSDAQRAPTVSNPSAAPRNARPRGEYRLVRTIWLTTPASATAAASPSAAGTVRATGLSSSRCFPARAAEVASSACTSGGTANATASQTSHSSSRLPTARLPCASASARAASGRRAHTPARVVSGPPASIGACSISAHGPAPTSPTATARNGPHLPARPAARNLSRPPC
jgi:hypothetical protein